MPRCVQLLRDRQIVAVLKSDKVRDVLVNEERRYGELIRRMGVTLD